MRKCEREQGSKDGAPLECGSHATAFADEVILRQVTREAWLPNYKAHPEVSGLRTPRFNRKHYGTEISKKLKRG